MEHLMTHTGEKPLQCGKSGNASSDKSNLFGHVRTHTGEKSHQCTVCGKGFSCESYLIRHVNTLSGEKPFQCSNYEIIFLKKNANGTFKDTYYREATYLHYLP